MEGVDTQSLLQTGGVGVLAVLVYLELRAVRPILRGLELAVSALLERERQRDPNQHRATPTNPFPSIRRLPTEPGEKP